MIFFENWNLRVEGQSIAQQFDHLTRTITVVGDIPEGWDWVLLVQVGEFMDLIPLIEKEGALCAVLTAQQLSIAGYYKVQLRGARGEQVKHTNAINVYISASLSGDEKWPDVPSEFTELERRSTEAAKEAKAAAITAQSSAEQAESASEDANTAKTAAQEAATNAGQHANNAAVSEQAAAEHRLGAERAALEAKSYTSHPAIIGENGNWQSWNGESYADTGKSSQGDLTQNQGDNLYANALKGSAGGASVCLEDISSLEHTVPVKVSSKNLYFNDVTKSSTVNGTLTLETTAKTSDFVLNGATAAECATVLSRNISLKAGTYTISLYGTNIIDGSWDRIYIATAQGSIAANYVRSGVPGTFTLAEDATVSVQAIFAAGTTYENATCSVQIEMGTTATAYTPYVDDLTGVTVTASGKNRYFNNKTATTTVQETLILSTVAGKSDFVLNGATAAECATELSRNIPLKAGTYTVSLYGTNIIGGSWDRIYVATAQGSMLANYIRSGVPGTFTLAEDSTVSVQAIFAAGTSYKNATCSVQIEMGTTATAYESCRAPAEYTPVEDGTCEVTSIAPTMTISTDTVGVVIDCEYNRDINKAFEQLTQAILSLGGNI